MTKKIVEEFIEFLKDFGIKYKVNEKTINIEFKSEININDEISIKLIEDTKDINLAKILFIEKRIFPILEDLKSKFKKKLKDGIKEEKNEKKI